MQNKEITVIICCAGLGTRLGIGSTKALIKIENKPLIIYQLELLKDFEDVRIVVGYQAKQVIEVVKTIRKDVTFVFNYNYAINGPGASLTKGMLNANKKIIVLDGDLVVSPKDFKKFIEEKDDCIAITKMKVGHSVGVEIKNQQVIGFNKGSEYSWTGLAKIESSKLQPNEGSVYGMLENLLPLKSFYMDIMGIDTIEDYQKAKEWVKNNYQ